MYTHNIYTTQFTREILMPQPIYNNREEQQRSYSLVKAW